MEIKIKQNVAESKGNIATQTANAVEQKQNAHQGKPPLTPYQKYKQSKNKNGKKYFEFYDDIKVYTHNIYDW